MQRIKKFMALFIIIIIIGLLFLFIKNSTRTVYNSDNAFGNTAGNLFNGGLFSEYGEKIYFSNINDDGTLYSMDLNCNNFKKINDDKIGYINATGNYIYYSHMNYKKQNSKPNVFAFKNAGIYRININGGNRKSLYDDPGGLVNVYGNTVYYQHYNSKDGLKFYKINIDGSGEKKLSEEAIVPMSIVNNVLYYTGTKEDHAIYSMLLATGSTSIIYEGNCYAPIINNNYIYYMSLSDNYSIYRIDLNGDNKTLILDKRCSTYNITEEGDYLYFQADDNKNNGIYKRNLLTGETDTIMEGDYKNIHIAGSYVFFTDFTESSAYYISVGASDIVSAFNPPLLSK